MSCPRYRTIVLTHVRLSVVFCLAVILGGGGSSSCKHEGAVSSSPKSVTQVPPPVPSPSKNPVIPAPELTTLAPAPTPAPSVVPKPKRLPKNQQLPSSPSSAAVAKPSTHQSNKIASLPLPSRPSKTSPRIPIRVAIAQQSPYLVIGASTSANIVNQQGQLVTKLMAASAENVVPQGGQLRIGSKTAPQVIWIKPESESGLIYVSGRWYRGEVQIIANNGQLIGVNHVDMESYLYSVVGSEMPASWPIEALKSQAIAARSYALAHIARPFNPLYDLGDTPRWQAYKGVETETNTTLVAVEQTAGLVLSHNGGVVESLYAASDQIVRDVHKGFGMSQNGANQLARQRYSFQQILAHFYPGTRLAWLQFSS